MDIGFFFTLDKEVVQLPINPPEIEVVFKGRNKQVDIIKLGEITMIKTRALATMAFETFLPGGTWFPGIRTLGEFKGPTFYKDFFERVFQAQKPMYLSITGLNITMKVTLEEFQYTHSAGEEEDPKVKFKLKEYTDYKIEVQNIPAVTTPTSSGVRMTVERVTTTPARSASEITVGATVILNGRVNSASTGGKLGMTFTNTECKVTLICRSGTYIYHVGTLSGSPLGWVLETAVKLK